MFYLPGSFVVSVTEVVLVTVVFVVFDRFLAPVEEEEQYVKIKSIQNVYLLRSKIELH